MYNYRKYDNIRPLFCLRFVLALNKSLPNEIWNYKVTQWPVIAATWPGPGQRKTKYCSLFVICWRTIHKYPRTPARSGLLNETERILFVEACLTEQQADIMHCYTSQHTKLCWYPVTVVGSLVITFMTSEDWSIFIFVIIPTLWAQ